MGHNVWEREPNPNHLLEGTVATTTVKTTWDSLSVASIAKCVQSSMKFFPIYGRGVQSSAKRYNHLSAALTPNMAG